MHDSPNHLLRTVDPVILGSRVRAARVAAGLTQTQVAGTVASTGYVSRIETGTRRPTLDVLSAIADRLGTTVAQLLTGTSAEEYDAIRLMLDYAELALETGEAQDAEAQARTGLQRASTAEQRGLGSRARYLLGRAVEAQGRLTEAIEIYEELAGEATGLELAACGIALTRCHKESGDLALAVETGERIEQRLRDAGLERTDDAVRLAVTIAGAYIERGDLNRALRVCSAALATAEQTDSRSARAAAYWNTSIARSLKGDTSDAIVLAERALALLGEGGDRRNLARLRLQLGRLMLRESGTDLGSAITHLTQARTELAASSASSTDVLRADLALAQAHLAADDPGRALELAAHVRNDAPEDAVPVRIDALITIGQARAARGDADGARADFRTAAQQLVGIGAQRQAAQVWCDLADLLAQVQDPEGALTAYRAAMAASGLTPRHHAREQTGSVTAAG
ncbi:MAG: helix-turn-helix domain-containing protein [Nocardioidaceae bacterium]|nr:helix-turn-helix domain-containing protein [Nocardioidaceae bacterium]MCL2613185.1 helix-turn-helix domain-containing protein [Nocardioidaceae bacterium]